MPRSRKQPKTLTEALRNAIAESGLSFIELERRTGVLRQCLMRFAKGEGSIRLDQADKLFQYWGLSIVNPYQSIADSTANTAANLTSAPFVGCISVLNDATAIWWQDATGRGAEQRQLFETEVLRNWNRLATSTVNGHVEGVTGNCVVLGVRYSSLVEGRLERLLKGIAT